MIYTANITFLENGIYLLLKLNSTYHFFRFYLFLQKVPKIGT